MNLGFSDLEIGTIVVMILTVLAMIFCLIAWAIIQIVATIWGITLPLLPMTIVVFAIYIFMPPSFKKSGDKNER